MIGARENLVVEPYHEERDADAPRQMTGVSTLRRLTPLAFIAVISFSAASRLNAYSVATSTAIGSDKRNGQRKRENEKLADHAPRKPFPTSSPNRFAMYCSSSSDVSAVRANTSGPKCSLRTYLWSIFTG